MKKIELYEVGPRDGLQNIGIPFSLDDKVRFVDALDVVVDLVAEQVAGQEEALAVPAQAEVEVEDGSVMIDNGIGLTGQSALSLSSDGPGTITVGADIQVENQSLLATGFDESSGGGVEVNGGISFILQFSVVFERLKS